MTGLESTFLAAGAGCYALGAGFAWQARWLVVPRWLLVGSVIYAIAITLRWLELGQGPFLTMYEILVSSLFSLGLVLGLACLWQPQACRGAPIATLVLLLMALWLAFTDSGHKPLPATYGNPWLWVHVVMGKLFLGCCLVASSLAASLLLGLKGTRLNVVETERIAWLWMMFAFVFHSAMLIAGAVWAQDAWGRYWDWDPLETWAFGTWLVMAFALHLRATRVLAPSLQHVLVVGVFVLAFLTFFGVPFVSLAPHKGAV